jgi:hypothetical protein
VVPLHGIGLPDFARAVARGGQAQSAPQLERCWRIEIWVAHGVRRPNKDNLVLVWLSRTTLSACRRNSYYTKVKAFLGD